MSHGQICLEVLRFMKSFIAIYGSSPYLIIRSRVEYMSYAAMDSVVS